MTNEEPGSGQDPDGAPAPRGRRRKGLIGVLIVAFAVAVTLLSQFVTKILIVAVAGAALSSVFGGPFDRLPDGQQAALQERFEAAIGNRLEGLSDAEATAKVTDLMWQGLPRLDDERLVERIRLSKGIMISADVPACAMIARANALGISDAEGMRKALGRVDAETVARWFDIHIAALEAQVSGVTPPRTVDLSTVDAIAGRAMADVGDVEAELIGALYGGQEARLTDDEACTAIRTVYDHIVGLASPDLEVMALYDVTP